MVNIDKIKKSLQEENVDGWLFYNFKNLDPSANNILEIPKEKIFTRRWFYFIPRDGNPIKLAHRIEDKSLDHLPGDKLVYSSWKELHQNLKNILSPFKHICMQYSPLNAIPYVSFVDAGTVELIQQTGVNIKSSANLIQRFEAVVDSQSLDSHKKAAVILKEIVFQAFELVKNTILAEKQITEYEVQQFIIAKFEANNMECDHPPIVAVNEHSGDPHYEPSPQNSSYIKRKDILLIDLWAKFKQENSIYADITWMCVVDDVVAFEYAKIFNIARDARENASKYIQERLDNNQEVYGYQIDDICRKTIEDAGYGKYFVHRTGHSIGKDVHWKGVNMDNFETKDERKLIDGILFSIEPGIYMSNFGVRTEIDMYIENGKAHISCPPAQSELIPILRPV